MKKNIFIRVDGNSRIGLGHLVRCIALAEMIKGQYELHFVSKEIPEGLEKEIGQRNFALRRIESEEEFISSLKENDIVILDHYFLDSDYQKTLKKRGCKLICIDDLHDKKFYADLVINHAPGVSTKDYEAEPYTDFALGTDYAMLRPEFLTLERSTKEIEKIRDLFICFGGSDQQNLTLKVLNKVLDFEQVRSISVVTGTAYPYLDELRDFVTKDNRIYHSHSLEAEEIMSEMSKADLAIVPASGILYEVVATNTPVITGSYIENQKYFLEQFSQLSSVKSAGNFNEEEFLKAFRQFLAAEKIVVKNEIDGRSPERILNKIKNLG